MAIFKYKYIQYHTHPYHQGTLMLTIDVSSLSQKEIAKKLKELDAIYPPHFFASSILDTNQHLHEMGRFFQSFTTPPPQDVVVNPIVIHELCLTSKSERTTTILPVNPTSSLHEATQEAISKLKVRKYKANDLHATGAWINGSHTAAGYYLVFDKEIVLEYNIH